MAFIMISVQVDGLFKELDNVLPNNFMSQMFGDPSVQPNPGRPPSSKLTQAQKEVGMMSHPVQMLHSVRCTSIKLTRLNSMRHARLFKSLYRSDCMTWTHAILVVYVRSAMIPMGPACVCSWQSKMHRSMLGWSRA